MYKVFNMGHRFEMYCAPPQPRQIIEIAEGFGFEAKVIGRSRKLWPRSSLWPRPTAPFTY